MTTAQRFDVAVGPLVVWIELYKACFRLPLTVDTALTAPSSHSDHFRTHDFDMSSSRASVRTEPIKQSDLIRPKAMLDVVVGASTWSLTGEEQPNPEITLMRSTRFGLDDSERKKVESYLEKASEEMIKRIDETKFKESATWRLRGKSRPDKVESLKGEWSHAISTTRSSQKAPPDIGDDTLVIQVGTTSYFEEKAASARAAKDAAARSATASSSYA